MRRINIVIADNNNSNAKELKDFLIAKDDIGMVHVVNNGRAKISEKIKLELVSNE